MEANVSPSSVQRWEAGRLPPVRELIRIAELLGIDPAELTGTEERVSDGAILAKLDQVLERLDRIEAATGKGPPQDRRAGR